MVPKTEKEQVHSASKDDAKQSPGRSESLASRKNPRGPRFRLQYAQHGRDLVRCKSCVFSSSHFNKEAILPDE